MSLLLDALKKAADEKKKNMLSTHEHNGSNTPNSDTSRSLELELELYNMDKLPELREPDKNHSASEKEKNIVDRNTVISTTGKTKKPQEANELKLQKLTPKQTKKITGQITPKSEKLNSAQKHHTLSLDNSPPEKTPDSTINNIKSEQALSQLINKSNLHNKNKQRKRNISIFILLLLVLTGSGLYFYIEQQTARQNIYITDSRITPPIPTVQANTPEPVTNNNPTAPYIKPAPSIKTAVNAMSSAPTSTRQPATAPPATTTTQHKKAPASVKFTRSIKSDSAHEILLKAYAAFYAKDYKLSETLYNKVLKHEVRNRDALLGLSAIAMKQQRYEYARQKYIFLLKLNPADNIAIAGLSSIDKLTNSQLNESKIRFMLKDTPDSAPLNFALGNIYSQQKKWPNAQAAYFSAWSSNNKNADYAFNLAISLDHLDKKNRALEFYQLSLALRKTLGANFSVDVAKKRIHLLQKKH